MTGAPPTQQELLRAAPELARAARLHRSILSLTHSRLETVQHDTLRRLLGELTSATWSDGYQAALEEMRS